MFAQTVKPFKSDNDYYNEFYKYSIRAKNIIANYYSKDSEEKEITETFFELERCKKENFQSNDYEREFYEHNKGDTR